MPSSIALAVVSTALLVLLRGLVESPAAPPVVTALVGLAALATGSMAVIGAWRRQPAEGSTAGPT